ncbi:hypothetical protein GCM10007049_27740 [Echinicola pacifica]|uniref:HPt domain-containing protein n=1 Tax=Echinicola pacifica TaxID=346377 RepID=A0A918UTF6_9BACT|nr:hypothetical protein [Echinicola pacifica]GGZ32671.1 hypothetical protein GCM10007049_27740 [Echinicola pacifica]
MDKVHEMAEGDQEFEVELLEAIASSVQELKERYAEAITNRDEKMMHQARHKVRPTVTIFELRKLSKVLENGRQLIETDASDMAFEEHRKEFIQVSNDLLSEIREA